MTFIFTLIAAISTFAGGLLGIKYKDKLHIILGFTAGVLLGVVAFDLFPEIIKLINKTNAEPVQPMIALVIGFLLFHVTEKSFLIHHSHEHNYGDHHHPHIGIASALALSGHSFLDGVGIGLGFQVSSLAGLLVALAVISHDFSDGLNTVSLTLLHRNTNKKAVMMLIIDALAPILGGLSTLFFDLPQSVLILYLGFFAGFLLYIGASEILPEAHAKSSSHLTIFMTILGTLFIFLITHIS